MKLRREGCGCRFCVCFGTSTQQNDPLQVLHHVKKVGGTLRVPTGVSALSLLPILSLNHTRYSKCDVNYKLHKLQGNISKDNQAKVRKQNVAKSRANQVIPARLVNDMSLDPTGLCDPLRWMSWRFTLLTKNKEPSLCTLSH